MALLQLLLFLQGLLKEPSYFFLFKFNVPDTFDSTISGKSGPRMKSRNETIDGVDTRPRCFIVRRLRFTTRSVVDDRNGDDFAPVECSMKPVSRTQYGQTTVTDIPWDETSCLSPREYDSTKALDAEYTLKPLSDWKDAIDAIFTMRLPALMYGRQV